MSDEIIDDAGVGEVLLMTTVQVSDKLYKDDLREVYSFYIGNITKKEYDEVFTRKALCDVYNSLRKKLNRKIPNCDLPQCD